MGIDKKQNYTRLHSALLMTDTAHRSNTTQREAELDTFTPHCITVTRTLIQREELRPLIEAHKTAHWVVQPLAAVSDADRKSVV